MKPTHWQEHMTPDEERDIAALQRKRAAAEIEIAKIKKRCIRRKQRFDRSAPHSKRHSAKSAPPRG